MIFVSDIKVWGKAVALIPSSVNCASVFVVQLSRGSQPAPSHESPSQSLQDISYYFPVPERRSH